MDEERSNIQRSLHYEIGTICRALEKEELSTAKDDSTIQISREAMAALTELTYHFSITSFAYDLSSFSAHGNRSIINGKDVKLALRKAPRRIREQFDKICADNKVNCATTTTTGKDQKKGNKSTSTFSKSPTDATYQGSSFNFNFEESSSDESDNSEIVPNLSAYRRSRKFSSSSNSSRSEDSSSVNEHEKPRTKRIEHQFSDKEENGKCILLQSINDSGCIDLSSD